VANKERIEKGLRLLLNLLDSAEAVQRYSDQDGKWLAHHSLLSMIPQLEQFLKLTDYPDIEGIINKVKSVANNLVPTDKLNFYG